MLWLAIGLILVGTIFLLIEVCLFPGKIMNAMLGVGFLGWGMYLFLENFPPWQGQIALIATLIFVSIALIFGLRLKNAILAVREEQENSKEKI